jgi:diguanylate cyclase (GGDEF)-like protein
LAISPSVHALDVTALEALPVPAYRRDRAGIVVACNAAFAVWAGATSPEGVVGRGLDQVLPAELVRAEGADDEGLFQLGAGAQRARLEWVTAPGGAPCWVQLRRQVYADNRGAPAGVVGVLVEAAPEEQAMAEGRELRQIQQAVEHIPEGFALYDPADRLRFHNGHFLDLYPSLRELPDIRGRTFAELTRYAMDQGDVLAPSDSGEMRLVEDWQRWHWSATGQPVIRQLGDGRWVRITEHPTAEGGVAALHTDVSEMKVREFELEASRRRVHFLAHHDSLTGLPNRLLLEDRLHQLAQLARRHASAVAVMYIDLDGFKAVNDRYGHAVGDGLLRRFADRLQNSLRESDTVARLGGDEFVGLFEVSREAAHEGARRVAERLQQVAAEPTEVESRRLQIGCSIGVCLQPLEIEDPDRALRAADQALYTAKENGKGGVVFYSDLPSPYETCCGASEAEGDGPPSELRGEGNG